MKRPPGLWILLSAGVLWLSLQNVDGVRATALIFAKTTTTTTDAAPASNASSSSDESSTEASTESTSNTTKPALTGNPQIDYIWDQNLPRELNGYNLSDYPFYERVPEDPPIDFKCDGLHDGFYASVPHKCQVYHHCLFGQRFDFLCANYTAFDQKTFICHFVSEVDCANSKKYWFRNDALYEAASTTTAKPSPAPAVLYTPPPQAPAAERAPNVGAKRRKPLRRRRPQYEYYDDEEYDDYYYDETPRARRKKPRPKPRPRPRPIYEDDYDEYEEDKYERRSSRKPYRRPNSGSQSRRKYKEEAEEVDYEDNSRSTERRPLKKKPQDDYEEIEERRPKPKKRRPPIDDYEDEPPRKATTEKTMIQPSSGSSIFNRPRAAPKIKPPVPKHEADKYAYKPVNKPDEVEYYDDYEDEPPKPTRKQSQSRKHSSSRVKNEETTTTTTTTTTKKPKASYRNRSTTKKPSTLPPPSDYEYEDDIIKTTRKPTTEAPEKEAPRPESIVRIVKRPFLPSRGGNPSPRGLQNVGSKAKEIQDESNTSLEPVEVRDTFKPSPVLIKMPLRQKVENVDEFRPISDRPQTPRQNYKANKDYQGPRTTQKPKIIEKNPLDIDDNEYDVTLNDALNPTLPNLPVRSFPTGFSAANDYTYSSFQRPRYVVEGAAGSDYTPNEQTYHRPRVTQAYYTSF